MARTPIALTIAGSDPSGGAGIQADLKTFSALSVYGASVICALTAQNTRGVTAVHEPPAAFVAAQLDAIFADLEVAAVKIGMLGRPAVIAVVAERVRAWGRAQVVLDPVMVAKGGARLLPDEGLAALREELLPLCGVLTPNLPEAAALLGEPEAEVAADPAAAAARLLALGPRAVVLKGGHLGGETSDDLFHDGTGTVTLPARRIVTRNTHGTGCTLSAAIAALLARGLALRQAVEQAKAYVTTALQAADRLSVGTGHGPVHHFQAWW